MSICRIIDSPTVKIQVQWEPRDCWVGLFWRRTEIALHLYVCLVPLLPLHVAILRRELRKVLREEES